MMIEVRPFTRADIPTLIGWSGSPEFLMQWAGSSFSYPLDQRQLRRLLQLAALENPTVMPFQVVERESGRPVGHLELMGIDRGNRLATLARVLIGPEEWRGKGIGTEMVGRVMRIGFEQLGLHRIQLHVFDFNESAIACYERLGFRKEGFLRESRRVGDRFRSVYVMALLEQEWRSVSSDASLPDCTIIQPPIRR